MEFINIKATAAKQFKVADYNHPSTSAWIDYQPATDRIKELHLIAYYETHPEMILDSFEHSSDAQKAALKDSIHAWLLRMKEIDQSQQPTEIRDFIYEMF